MNVLSLFDGMSCGQIALNKIGIEYNYYASEIKPHAIKCTQTNYPNTIQLGDIRKITKSDLPKIDLLIGGSPCQSFSFAGKRKGMQTTDQVEILNLNLYLSLKAEGFEFEGQSYLFWEYMRILKDIQQYNPDVKFLLENVMMGDKWQKVLTRAIGINPIEINSRLLSAQNRERLYWTNIGAQPNGLFSEMYCMIPQPKDKGLVLRDVLEDDVDPKYFLSEQAITGILKHKEAQEAQEASGNGFGVKFHKEQGKMSALKIGGKGVDDIVCVAMRGRGEAGNIEQQLEVRADDKTNTLTSVQKDNYIVYGEGYEQDKRAYFEDGKSGTLDIKPLHAKVLLSDKTTKKVLQINPSKESGGKQPYQQNRIYDADGIMPALCAQIDGKNNISLIGKIRRLTPIECERLQTVPDNYTNHVSDSQRYKMLGNGWTVDIIAYIFSYLNK